MRISLTTHGASLICFVVMYHIFYLKLETIWNFAMELNWVIAKPHSMQFLQEKSRISNFRSVKIIIASNSWQSDLLIYTIKAESLLLSVFHKSNTKARNTLIFMKTKYHLSNKWLTLMEELTACFTRWSFLRN